MALVFKKIPTGAPGVVVSAPVQQGPKREGAKGSPLKRSWGFGEFKPPGKLRCIYRPFELAEYIGCTEEEIHSLVEAGVGPEPIAMDSDNKYCFSGDSVEMWVLKGLPQTDIEMALVRMRDVWMVRSWGMVKSQRVFYGGPEDVPENFPWPDFNRVVHRAQRGI